MNKLEWDQKFRFAVFNVWFNALGTYLSDTRLWSCGHLQVIGSLSNDDADGNENGKKAVDFYQQNNNFAHH